MTRPNRDYSVRTAPQPISHILKALGGVGFIINQRGNFRMNKTTFIQKVLEGNPLVLVEYRSFKEDSIRYRVKTGPQAGQAVERVVIKHAVEMGASPVMVTEWLPEGTAKGTAVPPFKKGSYAVLELRGMTNDNGTYKAEGTLWPYDPSEDAPSTPKK